MSEGQEPTEWSTWALQRDTRKTLWVVAVMAFWGSALMQVVLFYLFERLNFVLMSVVLGTMILGIWLKARYQLHLRKEPPGKPQGELDSGSP